MENVEHLPTLNPWQEGDFLVYGDAVQLPDGSWAAYYRIDRHPAGGHRIETVVDRRPLKDQSYPTDDLARIAAVHYGQHVVREVTGG
ncbi:hypothetical protein QRO11_15510 [Paracidovorax citrulli]|nr:hypothetical protein [Paracidovorax citrulli]ATG94654.1 hypothetical protein CQB05_11970 [Paracidovorax citrulli]MVT38614.1 hypothetical protein [Paracidovorax citrulli]PVY66537.1 hypothetical protein C8E08_3946 [Paracidovorax citrulli]REG69294.1 hypothetical protein C8E07_2441 [Paracidovorax citrulli]RLJ93849.1 hypothetical protein C8E06_2441 [Paracidovorax citrulli]